MLEYRKATGLEAVFGYLSLIGDTQRMEYLIDAAYGEFFHLS
jgi:23S rRNA maturation mini-RNase III